MSICVYIKNKRIHSFDFMEETYPVPLNRIDNENFIYGEVFNNDSQNFKNIKWEDKPELINRYVGALSLFRINTRKCHILVDGSGINQFYYYKRDDTFIVSNDIWQIVKIIKPSFDDIDLEWVRRSLIYTSMNDHTFIKDIHIVLPNTIVSYDFNKNNVITKEFGDYHYTREIEDIDEAVENVDTILNSSFNIIQNKYSQRTIYGVGISGGLDSRVIPHYAIKNGMKLVGFNICTPKPHGLFLAESCRNAIKLANVFRVPLQLVEWKTDTVDDKISMKVRNYPLGSGRNSFKYETDGMPFFDVLLTGGTGVVVGSMLPSNITQIDERKLRSIMKQNFIHTKSVSSVKTRLIKAINYVFRMSLNDDSDSKCIRQLFSEEIKSAEEEIDCYITEMLRSGYDCFEIYERYLINVLGSKNRNGGFESILGTKKSYSIYVPFLMDEVRRWHPNLLINRKVLNELIMKKIPEVSDISTETYHGKPIDSNPSAICKLCAIITRVIKGNGSAIDENNIRKGNIKSAIRKQFCNGNSWFYNIFDKENVRLLLRNYSDPTMIINIWEAKALIDAIETKAYETFNP